MTGPAPLDRALYGATLLLALMPVLGLRTMVIVIGCWSILALVHFLQAPVLPAKSTLRWWLLLASPFLLMLLDLPRAADLRTGWRVVETSAALIVFPTVFLLLRATVDRSLRHRSTDLFSICALLLACFVDLRLLYAPDLMALPIGAPFSHRYREAFAVISGVHAPFAAYFFLSAALFQTAALLRGATYRALRVGLIAALVLSAALIASRMPLIAFTAAVLCMAYLRGGRRLGLRWGGGVAVAMVLVLLLMPTTRYRLQELSPWHERHPVGTPLNSVEVRGPVLDCSLRLVADHWAIGTGLAQVQPALDACYVGIADPQLLDGSHSTHCQPLHWGAAFGLVGIALFFLLFLVPGRDAWRHKDLEHVGFLLFIAVCCSTENVLARQWGAVLFAWANTLFLAARSHLRPATASRGSY